jgi:hypothetical protein
VDSIIQTDEQADTATLRAAMISWRMAHGWRPSTREVATLCGIGMSGAWRLMNRMVLSVPIAYDQHSRTWYDVTLRD